MNGFTSGPGRKRGSHPIAIAVRVIIRQYAVFTCAGLVWEFGQSISVDLILKNHDHSDRIYKANIDKVDYHVPEKYTAGEIRALTGG